MSTGSIASIQRQPHALPFWEKKSWFSTFGKIIIYYVLCACVSDIGDKMFGLESSRSGENLKMGQEIINWMRHNNLARMRYYSIYPNAL